MGGKGTNELYMSNLHDSLRQEVHKHQNLGAANRESLYVQGWEAVQPYVLPDISNGFMTEFMQSHIEQSSFSRAERETTLRYRFGQINNMRTAYVQNRPYYPGQAIATNDRCPICGGSDSIAHIAGGCRHPNMKAKYIFRHDEACRMAITAFTKGTYGSFLLIADVGSEDKMRELGVHSKRIPAWALPNHILADVATTNNLNCYNNHALDREKLRPDIMIVELSTPEQARHCKTGNNQGREPLNPNIQNRRPRKVWILEGG